MDQPVIFDCDGVLVNSESIYVEVERAILAEIGLVYDHGTFLTRFVGLNDGDFLAALEQDFSALGQGEFPAEFLPTARRRCAQRMETDLIAIPGLTELLKAHTGPRAVASSSKTELLTHKLSLTGLAEFFGEHVYSADLVENGKPAPDLFLLAAERIRVPPRSCIVIEDSINGVQSGCSAGMKVWGFTGGGHADAGLAERLRVAGATEVFATFDELAASLTGH